MKNKKIVAVLVGIGFLIIMISLMATIANSTKEKRIYNKGTKDKEEISSLYEKNFLAIFKGKNKEDSSITLQTTEGEEIKGTLTGGSDIRDRYNQAITIDSVSVGEVVQVVLREDTGKVLSLIISDAAFVYRGVNNWYFDEENNALHIADSVYRYRENTVIARGDELLTIEDVSSKDELTVRGVERDILSIEVTKGHGTIYFSDYDDFIGGVAYIGKREIIPIVEEMATIARVGSFDITFENGSLTGTKSVTLETDGQVYVSMEEFKKPPVEKGLVQFTIHPRGADLYLNDEIYEYDDIIELEYGEYTVKVSLGGYISYTGVLKLEEKVKTIYIDLVEEGKKDPDNNNPDEIDSSEQPDVEEPSSGDNDNEGSGSQNPDTDEEEAEISTDKGYIYVQSPDLASVYFDGEFKGNVPVAFPKESGTHYITFILQGYQTKTYTVEITEGDENQEFRFPSLKKQE